MTTDLIELAKQAGMEFDENNWLYVFSKEGLPIPELPALQAFADLIRKDAFRDGYEKGIAGFMEAVKLEREQCAGVCTGIANRSSNAILGAAIDCAAAIRARTTT